MQHPIRRRWLTISYREMLSGTKETLSNTPAFAPLLGCLQVFLGSVSRSMRRRQLVTTKPCSNLYSLAACWLPRASPGGGIVKSPLMIEIGRPCRPFMMLAPKIPYLQPCALLLSMTRCSSSCSVRHKLDHDTFNQFHCNYQLHCSWTVESWICSNVCSGRFLCHLTRTEFDACPDGQATSKFLHCI